MKILSLLLSLMISFNLFASENSGKLLSQLVDNYQYALTVEWDQKDKVAFQKINEEFRSEVVKVIQHEGMSKKDLSQFVEARITNKKVLNDLQTKIQQMPSEPTASEIYSLFQDTKSSLYSQGASWNGDVVLTVGATLLSIALLTFMVTSIIKGLKTCESEGGHEVTTQTNCGIRSVCVDYGQNYCHAYQEQYACDEKVECIN